MTNHNTHCVLHIDVEKCIDYSSKAKILQDVELRATLDDFNKNLKAIDEMINELIIPKLAELVKKSNLSQAVSELREIEFHIRDLYTVLREARRNLEELREEDVIFADCASELEKALDCLESILKDVGQRVADLYKRIPILTLTNLSDALGQVTGLPYFSANIHGGFMSVTIREGVKLKEVPRYGKEQSMCNVKIDSDAAEEKQDDSIVALYRLTPLSIYTPEKGIGIAYTLVPPAQRKGKGVGYEYDVRVGYVTLWRKKNTLYPCNCISGSVASRKSGLSDACGGRKCDDIAREMLERLVKQMLLPGSKVVPRRLGLGFEVSEVNVPEYRSGLQVLLCHSDPILVVYNVSVQRAGRTIQRYWVIFGVDGYDENEGVLPAAVCKKGEEPKLFIGIPKVVKEAEESTGLIRVRCPLVELYNLASSIGGRYGSILQDMLRAICSRVDVCAQATSGGEGYVLASDVYSYLIRTKPLISSFTRVRDAVRGVRGGAVKGVVARVDSTLAYNTIVIESRLLDDRLYYPLPFWLEARVLSTYALLYNIDGKSVEAAVDTVIDELASIPPETSRLAKSLFVRSVLAASGILSKNMWKSIRERMYKGCDSGEERIVSDALLRIVKGAYRAARMAYYGESYILSLSGLRRGTELLLDIAILDKVCDKMSLGELLRLFAKFVTSGEGRQYFQEYLKMVSEMSAAHLVALALIKLFEQEEELQLLRLRYGDYNYAFVEMRQGGLGFIPTLTTDKLIDSLTKLPEYLSGIAARIAGQHSVAAVARLSKSLAQIDKVVREIAWKTARAYGQLASRTGNTLSTYIPAWLARLPLTEDKLRVYAEQLGLQLPEKLEETLRIVHHELIGAHFDTDFVDASQYDIGGVESWLGEYEKKVLLSTQLGLMVLTSGVEQ